MNNSENNLLPIGVIADSYGVSGNCIRRMEAAGLLKPAHVSEKSGYRYYNSSDIVRISTILTLKSFGFLNKDIASFMQNPVDLTGLYHKLQDMQHTINNLLQQLDRRMKTPESYKCSFYSFNEAFYYTQEITQVPHLDAISDFACRTHFEAVKNKLPVDYTHPLLIETSYVNYRTYDPRAEQKLLFHIPLRKPVEGPEITCIPLTRAVDVKWSYPGTKYSEIVPIIDQFFDLFDLKQTGTLRATFDTGINLIKESDITNTVMHILIPVD